MPNADDLTVLSVGREDQAAIVQSELTKSQDACGEMISMAAQGILLGSRNVIPLQTGNNSQQNFDTPQTGDNTERLRPCIDWHTITLDSFSSDIQNRPIQYQEETGMYLQIDLGNVSSSST